MLLHSDSRVPSGFILAHQQVKVYYARVSILTTDHSI